MEHKGKIYLVVTFSSPIGKKMLQQTWWNIRGKYTLLWHLRCLQGKKMLWKCHNKVFFPLMFHQVCCNIFFPLGDENVTTRYFFSLCFIRFVVTFFSPIGDENVTTKYFFPLCSIRFVVTFFFPIGNENVTTRYFFPLCFIRFVVTFFSL